MIILLIVTIAIGLGIFFYFNTFGKTDRVDIIPAICIGLIIVYGGLKYFSYAYQTSDYYITHHPITTASYYEPWDEKVPCRHPVYRESCSGSGKSRSCLQVYVGNRHFYDVDYHPARWDSVCSGTSLDIDQSKFNELTTRWGNKTFVNLNRNFHSINGNKYVTKWPSEVWDKFEMCSLDHSIENLAKYTIRDLEIKSPVYQYDNVRTVQGWGDQRSFEILNAKSGIRNLRFHLLVYRNQTPNIFQDQKIKWKGGKAGDFVIGVNLGNNNKPEWVDVFSWTENEMMKSEVRGFIMSMDSLDTRILATFLEKQTKSWRFNNLERYKYIDPPTLTAVLILQFLLIIGVLCGTVYLLREQLSEQKN